MILEVNMNNIERYLGRVFVYLSLLTCGLLMTKSAIDQYLQWKTTFETQEIPLTLEDLPVFTICYQEMHDDGYLMAHPEYCHSQILNQSIGVYGHVKGDDYQIEETFVTLFSSDELLSPWNGHSNRAIHKEAITYKRMYGLELVWNSEPYCAHCVQISFDAVQMKKKFPSFTVWNELSFQFQIRHENEKAISARTIPVAYITTASNSFGALKNHWYDGQVKKIDMGWRTNRVVYMTGIKETFFVDGTCSEKSYYQSLDEILLNRTFPSGMLKSSNCGMHEKIPGCPIRYECLSQTLSFDVPVCPENYERNSSLACCYLAAMKMAERDLQSSSKKSCTKKEFHIEERGLTTNFIEDLFVVENSTNKLANLGVRFKATSRGVWTRQLVKTVNREFYIENGFGLFGTIGGTLGMFVGITFLDIFSWMKSSLGFLNTLIVYRKSRRNENFN